VIIEQVDREQAGAVEEILEGVRKPWKRCKGPAKVFPMMAKKIAKGWAGVGRLRCERFDGELARHPA